ncbi:MAG: hypothetical protein CK534_06055 [Nitrospirae bacterium]|nr:MAG: hypothetical protein CK534_06055 [Nitrospirota bacterium]
MSYEIQKAGRGGKVALHFNGAANTTIELNGATNSAINVATEAVTAASITAAYWSSNGVWTIRRGGSTGTDVLSLDGTGSFPLYQNGIVASNTATSNIYVSLAGSGTRGTLILELSKVSTFDEPT